MFLCVFVSRVYNKICVCVSLKRNQRDYLWSMKILQKNNEKNWLGGQVKQKNILLSFRQKKFQLEKKEQQKRA